MDTETEGRRRRVNLQVTKTFSFDAAHQLPWHEGKCRRLHGHTYRLEVSVAGPIDENGIIIDFDELSTAVRRAIVDRFDHQLLNEHFPNPTAELLAVEFTKLIEAEGLDLCRLTLWETSTSSATVEV
jgi:6-pyruvoyltetrahydropterin/6-carboxytetrahydropterin synthase